MQIQPYLLMLNNTNKPKTNGQKPIYALRLVLLQLSKKFKETIELSFLYLVTNLTKLLKKLLLESKQNEILVLQQGVALV